MIKILLNIVFTLTMLYANHAMAVCDPLNTRPEDCACAADLDNDGLLATEGEMEVCSNLADGGLCGIGKQNCVLTPPPPQPAPGFYCPLTDSTSGCTQGAHNYVLDPATGNYAPSQPVDFISQYNIQPNYMNAINTNINNCNTAITCEAPAADGRLDTELCTNPPAPPPVIEEPYWQCPITGATCETGRYDSLVSYCEDNYWVDPTFTNTVCVKSWMTWIYGQPRQTMSNRLTSLIDNNYRDVIGLTTCENNSNVDQCDYIQPDPIIQPAPAPTPPPPPADPTYICPYTGQPCIADESDGQMRCSDNECQDLALSGDTADPISTEMYVDDAGYDNAGNCLGDLYIYNGRPMRCHPSAPKTYFRNCCSNSLVGDSIPENVGKEAEMGLKMEGLYISASVMYAATSSTVTAAANGWGAAQSAGAGVAAGEQAVAELMGGWNLAFLSVAALNYLYANSCDQIDFETVLLKKSGMCMEYGTRCIDDSVFGCMKRQTSFCCFNSKLARIFHEQGRPQLSHIDWGTVDQPNCRGFTPQEFQSIDFTRIDLSEYYGHMRAEIEEDIPNMQNTIQSDVQDSIQNMR